MRARRSSQTTPGRIAAATITPRKTRAITTLIFQRASAAMTMPRTTRVATATRRAVVPMTRDCCPVVERANPMVDDSEELVLVDERRHGIVLVRPLGRALLLALLGLTGFILGWPASVPGSILLAAAAGYAVAAVWRWDRTHVIVTTEQLFVSDGIVRRRAAAVQLA